ncbi:hypothetical protein GW17_00035703 [Ensete ventricosum]|nr:hypothetical protein GW17_00035703 [Ensete ventricosum]
MRRIGEAPYRAVRIGSPADRYADCALSGGIRPCCPLPVGFVACPRREKDRGDDWLIGSYQCVDILSVSVPMHSTYRPTRFAILIFTAWYGRYISVRQVAGTWTARYRAVLSKIDHR